MKIKDLDKGEWMCAKCRRKWKENNYNVIVLCELCIVKRRKLI